MGYVFMLSAVKLSSQLVGETSVVFIILDLALRAIYAYQQLAGRSHPQSARKADQSRRRVLVSRVPRLRLLQGR
jgi:hypothetical protein